MMVLRFCQGDSSALRIFVEDTLKERICTYVLDYEQLLLVSNSITIKIMKKSLAVGAIAALLLSAAPAFADSDMGKKKGDREEGRDKGLHLGIFLGIGDKKEMQEKRKEMSEEQKAELKALKEKHRAEWEARLSELRAHITGGVVTAVNGSVFTIDTFGAKGTTTVTTDADTIFKLRGGATSTAGLSVGSKVLLHGTTTATSTAGDIFAADIVKMIGRGWGHLKHWLKVRMS